MNGLNSDVCYNILSLLQNNVCPVENVCNICGASHYTQNCPDYSVGEHVRDAPLQNMSRSSVPSGLHIIETDEGTCVVTSQKFAKGSRFGPLLAEKSYYPVENSKFPLIIFGNPLFNVNDPEIEHLFKERNLYLNTVNENNCNWMIHVAPAKYSNEQNLICFQLHKQIYYTAIHDIDVGDILKVWYAPKYAAKMNIKLLQSSPHEIVNNVLRQVSMGTLDSFVEDSLISYENNHHKAAPEISLPPINSLMRTPSINFYQNNNYLYSDYQSFDTEPTELNINMNLMPSDLDFNNLSNSDLLNFSMGSTNLYNDDSDDLDNIKYVPYDENETLPKKKKLQNGKNKPAVYSCNLCNKTYVAICNLNKHNMQVHKLHLCNLCMMTFKTMEALKLHVCPNQTFDSECSKCPICYKVLANQWSLARHVKCTHKGYTISVKKKEIILAEKQPTVIESSQTNTSHLQIPNEILDSKDLFTTNLHFYDNNNQSSLPGSLNESSSSETSIKFENISDDDMNLPPLVSIAAKSSETILTSNASPVKAAIARALVSKLTKKKQKKIIADGGGELDKYDLQYNEDDELMENISKKIITKKNKETIRTHKCDECGKMYAKKDGLQKHKLTHENRSYFCPFCSHPPLKSNDSLRRHFRLNHPDVQTKWAVKGFINSCIVKNNENTEIDNQITMSNGEQIDWTQKVILETDETTENPSPLRINQISPINRKLKRQNQNCDLKSAKKISKNNFNINLDDRHHEIFMNSNTSVQNLLLNNNNNNNLLLDNCTKDNDNIDDGIVDSTTKFLTVYINDQDLNHHHFLEN